MIIRKYYQTFVLITIRAVETIGNNTAGYHSWFEALRYLKNQIGNIEYDIVLIEGGAYAFPLSAYTKEKGKKAVVTAGVT